MAGGALEHLAADRSVGPGVAENGDFRCGEMAFGVATHRVVHSERVALRMHADRLFAGELDPHRTRGQAREKRRLRLNGHVLLATEGAAVGGQFDEQPILRLAKDGGDLAAVLEDSLALAQDVQPAVGQRAGETGFWLQKQMLDTLGLPFAADDMGGGRERGIDVAARVPGDRKHIPVPGIDLPRSWPDRFSRVEHRTQQVVLDLDERRGLPGKPRRFGGDRGKYVADIARLFAFGDEDGPVGVDLPDPAVAPDVCGRGDRGDPAQRQSFGDVEAHDFSAGVFRQHDGAVEKPGRVDVGDEWPPAEGELGTLIAPKRFSDPAVFNDRRRHAASFCLLNELDRVDDLHIAGTAAEMPVEMLRNFGA